MCPRERVKSNRQFACGGNGGDLLPSALADAQEECAQWSRCLGCGPCRFDQHRSRVGTAALAYLAVLGWL